MSGVFTVTLTRSSNVMTQLHRQLHNEYHFHSKSTRCLCKYINQECTFLLTLVRTLSFYTATEQQDEHNMMSAGETGIFRCRYFVLFVNIKIQQQRCVDLILSISISPNTGQIHCIGYQKKSKQL